MVNISISTNMLIIISCVVLFFIIGIIVYIIYKDKKNDQDEIDDLIDDIVKAKPRRDEIKVQKIEPSESKLNLEEMLGTMQDNLEKTPTKPENYEQDQEENAIISYKELLKQKNKNVDNYELDQENNAIISLKQLNNKNSLENLIEKEEQIKPKKIAKIESPREDKDKKFKNTDFISPIFGKMDEHIEYPKIKSVDRNDDLSLNGYFGEDVKDYYKDANTLGKGIDMEPLTSEVKKNDEFLQALKEFRSNL